MLALAGEPGKRILTEGNKANGEDREKYFHLACGESLFLTRMALSLGIDFLGCFSIPIAMDDFVD